MPARIVTFRRSGGASFCTTMPAVQGTGSVTISSGISPELSRLTTSSLGRFAQVVALAGWPPMVQVTVSVWRTPGGQHCMSGAQTSPRSDALSQSLSCAHDVQTSSSACSHIGGLLVLHAFDAPTTIAQTHCKDRM